jgi:hypothetical protein
MEIVYILQVITISVSIISVFINAFLTLSVNKRKQISDTVAKQRLLFLQQYRNLFSQIIALCDVNSIMFCEQKNFYFELCEKIIKLKILFKRIYSQEKELLYQIDKLRDCAITFYQSNADVKNMNALKDQVDTLYQLIDIYDLAYWRFIINQASGKNVESDNFDKIYEKVKKEYIDAGVIYRNDIKRQNCT